jgi:hypothetical protein
MTMSLGYDCMNLGYDCNLCFFSKKLTPAVLCTLIHLQVIENKWQSLSVK